MSEHRVVLPLRNTSTHELTVFIEPWGLSRKLAPGAEVFVVAKGPLGGDLDVQRTEREVTVYGWEGSQVAFSATDPGAPAKATTPIGKLADWIVEQMRTPTDPKAQAAADAFEDDKADVLAAWMVGKGKKPPTARTRAEMEFAASLVPCPKCKTLGLSATELTGSGQAWTLAGTCPGCGTRRSFSYATEGDPSSPHGPNELSPRASFLITAPQFRAELERLLPLATRDEAARHRALICITELLKLADPGPPRDKLRAELQGLVTGVE
jgi:hypothetical protein